MRMKIVDLSAIRVGIPYPVTLNCAYWMLIVNGVSPDTLLDNTPFGSMVTSLDTAAKGVINMHFPPVFDATGKPVMWRQVIHFFAPTAPTLGVLIQVYWDPSTPTEADQ